MLLTYAAGCEPFQDIDQASAILGIAARMRLALFVQTRAMNWRAVWPQIRSLAGNIFFYVSIPTLDPRVVKRFEPGTPPIEERIALVHALVDADIPVMVAMAPYHADWCSDMEGFAREVLSWGVQSIFWDGLHLNDRQRQSANDRLMVDLEATAFGQQDGNDVRLLRQMCIEANVGFSMVGSKGVYANAPDVPMVDPHPFRHSLRWPYVDTNFLHDLEDLTENDGPDDLPTILRWADALTLMEQGSPVEQPFAFGPIRDPLLCVKKLAPAWQRVLKPTATAAQHFRALWNTPKRSQFAWRHPFAHWAARPDGQPWRDDEGNIIMAFRRDLGDRSPKLVIEDLEACDSLEIEEVI